MTKDNLKLLDMDEHQREMHAARYPDLLEVCKTYGLILDLATSDNCAYVEDKCGNTIGIP